MNELELSKLRENLAGYELELSLQERKRAAIVKTREIVKKGIRKITPTFEYEEDNDYWDAQRELYDIDIEEKLFNIKKIINTVKDLIANENERLERIEGEKNE